MITNGKGHKRVRITEDVWGGPVGFEGWFNGGDTVYNDDYTKFWFHSESGVEFIEQEFKVGDKITWKFKEGVHYHLQPDWGTEIYTVVDKHPLGYCEGMCAVAYSNDGKYKGYIYLGKPEVDYLLVEGGGTFGDYTFADTSEPDLITDGNAPYLRVDDNGKVIEDNLEATTSNPLKVQYGGTHYKDRAIQPIEYILANDLNFCEGCVVKYVTRWRDKGGIEDLKKAKHYIDFLIENKEKQE